MATVHLYFRMLDTLTPVCCKGAIFDRRLKAVNCGLSGF
jgi:hypothetical protein